MLFGRWTQRRLQSASPTRGYDIEQVDAFLAYIGAEHAHGVDGPILARAIDESRFKMVAGGYDPETIDRHMAKLHENFTGWPAETVTAA